MAEISFTTCGTAVKSTFCGSEEEIGDWSIYIYDHNGCFIKRLCPDGNGNVFHAVVGENYSFFALANFSDVLTARSSCYESLEKASMEEMENLYLEPLPLEISQRLEMAWALKNHTIYGNENLFVNFRRLFAKVILNIDKSLLQNTDIQIVEAVVMGKNELAPFSAASLRQFPQEKIDFTERQDIEILNSGKDVFLYVPESIIPSGVKIPPMRDSWDKDLMLFNFMGYSDLARRCSYIELQAEYSRTDRISPSELEYKDGKKATYRFVLGGNDLNDCNVRGNSLYHLYLHLTDDGVLKDCWRASLDDYYGYRRLIRWEDRDGDADIANAIDHITIDNFDMSVTAYPKLISEGSVLHNPELKILYPEAAVIEDGGNVTLNGATISGDSISGITIKGGKNMSWSDFPITAEWTDDGGNSISSCLTVRLRPSSIDIEDTEDNGTLQNIVF